VEIEGKIERSRGWIALIEGVLALFVALAVTLVGSMALLFGMAAVMEEGGLASLVDLQYAVSVPLVAAEGELNESPLPDLDPAKRALTELLPDGRAIVYRTAEGGQLLAWQAIDPPAETIAALTSELALLGWGGAVPEVTKQRRLEGLMQEPAQMKRYLPAMMTLQAIAFIAVAGLLLWWRKPLAVGLQKPIPKMIGWGLLGAVGAFLTSTLLGGLFQLLGIGIEEQPWIQALLADRAALMTLVPWLVLVGPIAEEVFFRGYMFRRLLPALGRSAAYLISAFAFGVIHFNWTAIPIYAAVGLWLAFVYERSGRLGAALLGHIFYNGIVLAIGVIFNGSL
jgi:membrane protease YdiL (CAAX protease family)